MSMRRAPTGKTLAIGLFGLVVLAGSFGACAKGSQGPGDTTGGGGGGGSTPGASSSTGAGNNGGNGGSGQLGDPCKKQIDCSIGKCLDLGDGSYCTTECPPSCPGAMYCGIVDGKSVCIPDKGQLCEQCSGATACAFDSDRCLAAPAGDKFCARDCTTDGFCPNGFECVNGDNYEKGGSSGSGGSGGGSGTGGAGGAGGSQMPGEAVKFCVPNSGASCPCDEKRDGVSRSCDITNQNGSCSGSEVCEANKGKFVNCSAKTPKKETCNDKDDNCDGKIDEGDGNDLCSSMGAPPPHAAWSCMNATCKLGACEMGWANYPAGPVSDGCPCKIDGAEPNDTCAQATNSGSVSDTGGSITLTGTLSSDADVDVYTFNTTDSAEGNTDSYHVGMVFTEPTSNSEFQMDVIRGATCTNTPTGAIVNLTSYDWCVNGTDGASPPTGLGPCGNSAGQNHCADLSSKYFVRVHRKVGATPTCSEYKIVVTAKGGTCDFTQKCP